jgi:AraC family transcriptional regulator, regulatory protein of adaptative response / DNA-3-methyladenine glycosylase II
VGRPITVRLERREPFAGAALLRFLGARAVPGVESCAGGTYRRTLRLPHGAGVAELAPVDGHVRCTLRLDDERDRGEAVGRCRRLLDLDADPAVIDGALAADPLLAHWVQREPGRRLPGAVDGDELAVRALLGQQISVAAARTLAGRLVARLGEPLAHADGELTHLFPAAGRLAALDPAALPMPRSRGAALVALARSLADGAIVIDRGGRAELERRLLGLPGIGRWTADYVAMRVLGDPDVFLPGDVGVRNALRRLGVASDPRSAATLSERWRPWRSYALMYLWSSLESSPPPAPGTQLVEVLGETGHLP